MTDLPHCVLDAETRSALDIKKTNAYVYARHPTTAVWLLRYTFDGGETIHRWSFGEPCPDDIRAHLEAGGTFSFHNAGFEYFVWNENLALRLGWPEIPLTQVDDTAARAARCGLPRSLEKAAQAAGIAQAKDTKGAMQMKRMAKPRKVFTPSNEYPSLFNDDPLDEYRSDPLRYTVWDGTVYEWWADDERLDRLGTYCDQDVRTQAALDAVLPPLPDSEWEIWQATMRANIRGVKVDVPFIEKAITLVKGRLARYAEDLRELTGGQAKNHNDLNGMKAWLNDNGAPVTSLDKNVVASILEDDSLPAQVRQVAKVRAESGKTSVAKYPAMLNHADEDGIARELLVYHGATATGRWSGQGMQLQNYPARGGVGYERAEAYIDLTHRADAAELDDLLALMETVEDGSAIETLSMCLRGAVTARDGMEIIGADYSNIEGRDAAWLGGETWKLEAFRAFDAGEGPDLYKIAAGGILGLDPEDVSKIMRNAVGKVSELALQFGGGVGAFLSMAKNYRVEIGDYWDEIRVSVGAEIVEQAKEAWETRGKKSGTPRITWIAAEAVKIAWRRRHPGIVGSWYECEDAAVAALQNPGRAYYACDGKLGFLSRTMFGKPFLLLRLPSGRCIHYANARIKDGTTPWGAVKPVIYFDKVEGGRILRESTYGGDLFQSAVQGSARDIMAGGWLNVENAGYHPLFSVHDEMISEALTGIGDLDQYSRLLCQLPDWAAGLPVTADGYIGTRFRKD